MRLTFIKLLFMLFLSSNLKANNLALPCAGCHGPEGNSPGDTIPSIKNLDKKYFINALKAYKNGTRPNYIMQIISKGYTDKEIELLAEYYGK